MADTVKMNLESTLSEIAKFQFILSEGRKGHHLLFDHESIKDAFKHKPEELMHTFETKLNEINEVLNEVFALKTFEQKRAYINTLSNEIKNALVYGYFQLLDGRIQGQEPFSQVVH